MIEQAGEEGGGGRIWAEYLRIIYRYLFMNRIILLAWPMNSQISEEISIYLPFPIFPRVRAVKMNDHCDICRIGNETWMWE